MKQRCLKCYVIKDSKEFSPGQKFCASCLGTKKKEAKCYRCNTYKDASKVNDIGVCTDCLSKEKDKARTSVKKTTKKTPSKSIPKTQVNVEKDLPNKKDLVIEELLMSVEELNITTLRSLETIHFEKENYKTLRRFKMDELEFILEDINGIKEDLENKDSDGDQELINPLTILEKYKDGKIKVDDLDEEETNNQWRQFVPSFMKQRIPGWRNKSLMDFYNEAKALMDSQTGAALEKTRGYVSELSQIVFEEKNDNKNEEDNEEEKSDIEASILSVVEMIILPHLEVLNKIEEHNGKILFSDIWNKPFDDSLKKDVKDRDGWRCVVCESDTDLHVHHKIPRRLGGINHQHNLVTLCASCHKAIETADVQRAYKKCLINYRKNRASADLKRDYSSQNKALLKQEVEDILDKVLITLGNREDDQLVREISSVMDRLEVIFYEN
jgi:HNH endonuclease